MFGHYSYLIYMLIFTLIPIVIIWSRYYKELWKEKATIFKVVLLLTVYETVADAIGEGWDGWIFSHSKTLGIWVINFPIENVIFTMLTTFAVASAVIAFIVHQKRRGAKLS